MISSTAATERRRAAAALCAAALLAVAAVDVRAAAPVLLQFKGSAGNSYSHDFHLVAKAAARAGGQRLGEFEQAATMEIETTVVAARPNGRQTLEERLRFIDVRMSQNGQTTLSFDSRKPADLARARGDPNFEYLLASLEARARIEQDATGEVLGAEVDVPGAAAKPALKPVASQFLLQAIGLSEYHVPARPVVIGQSWECASFETPIVGGAGSIVGTARCTVSDVRNQDGEATAFITFKRSGSLRQNPESGTQARLLTFAEQGELHFAIERGRIKYLGMTGRTSVEFTRPGQQHLTESDQQMSLREKRR